MSPRVTWMEPMDELAGRYAREANQMEAENLRLVEQADALVKEIDRLRSELLYAAQLLRDSYGDDEAAERMIEVAGCQEGDEDE